MFSFFKKKTQPEKYVVPEGSKNLSLEEIDTSYWMTKDKEWMAERQATWPKIEPMLCNHKTTAKAMNIVKAYYLRGKMPDWKALEEWRDDNRHVDLLVFLWLHPSWDEVLLKELRDLYAHSDLIVRNDIGYGLGMFLWSLPIRVANTSSMENVDFPDLKGHTELMFRVLLNDPIQHNFEVINTCKPLNQRQYHIREPDLTAICTMAAWLVHTETIPVHREFLFQFDQPLEWWCETVRDVDYFSLKESNQGSIPSIYEALYRIHHFDADKEGDTCRTDFVLKIRTILDEREFFLEFKQMWLDVKAGKIKVEDPWEY